MVRLDLCIHPITLLNIILTQLVPNNRQRHDWQKSRRASAETRNTGYRSQEDGSWSGEAFRRNGEIRL